MALTGSLTDATTGRWPRSAPSCGGSSPSPRARPARRAHAQQHQLLLAIRGLPGPGPASISDVADALLLRLHSTTELVGRAVDDGLVERRRTPPTPAAVLLELTPAGADKLAVSGLHRAELQRFRREMSELGELD